MPINGNYSEKNLKRLNKISFSYKPGWNRIELECGNCPECKLKKANDWATRIFCEMQTWHGVGIFATYTYRPEDLPLNKDGIPTLKPSDMVKFKKRLRKYINKHGEASYYWNNPKSGKLEKPIRTFECGEYGDKHGRPHYHQIIFNWIPKDLKFYKIEDGNLLYKSKTLKKIWGKGKIVIGMVSYESASYVARYTMKKQGLAKVEREYYTIKEFDEEKARYIKELDPECNIAKLGVEPYSEVRKYRNKKGDIEPEYITMSTAPGLGYLYFEEKLKTIKENNCIMVKSNKGLKLKRIPRYFKKLWERWDWQSYERWKYNYSNIMARNTIEKIEKYMLPPDWTFEKKLNFVTDKENELKMYKFNLLKRDRADNDNLDLEEIA